MVTLHFYFIIDVIYRIISRLSGVLQQKKSSLNFDMAMSAFKKSK